MGLDPNFAGILADIVVFVHLCYMGYIVFGQLLIMIGWPLGWQWVRNPWFRGTHLAMILVVALEGVVGYRCPLTTWENELRETAGQDRTDDGEIKGISFTGQLLRNVQFAGEIYWEDYINTTFYVAAALIVATALLAPPRWRRKAAGSNPPSPQVRYSEPAG